MTQTPRRAGITSLVLLCIVALNACGSIDPGTGASETEAPFPTATPSSLPDSLPPIETTALSAELVQVTGTYKDVDFYPACGNEVLDHQGVKWYPLAPLSFVASDTSIQDRLDEVLAVERENPSVAGVHGFTQVVAPGVGDDVGTLTIWADGVARWTSASGDLDVWMVDDKVQYNWAC
jgi:hypothetical protein